MKEAEAESFRRGFEAGRAAGIEEHERSTKIAVTWSPATDLMNRAYTDPDSVLPNQYVYRQKEVVLQRAASWRSMLQSSAWSDLRAAVLMDARRRMSDMIAGRGNQDVHRAMIKFEEELLGLPDTVIAYADQLQQIDTEQPVDQE